MIIATTVVLAQPSLSNESLIISSIDWCPQLCDNDSQRGYVMDIVDAIFKDSPYTLEVENFPWTRAIRLVENGRSHALLAPTREEAPNLKFPEQEIGLQRMCFFTKSSSEWAYTGEDSLKGLTIGLAQDTYIDELSEYIEKNEKQFDYIPYSDGYLTSSFKKLTFNRIDTFVFTYNSTRYEINRNNLEFDYKEAGCFPENKIYMAFSPNEKNEDYIDDMIVYFDSKMVALKKSDEINEIMSNYGLNYLR